MLSKISLNEIAVFHITGYSETHTEIANNCRMECQIADIICCYSCY